MRKMNLFVCLIVFLLLSLTASAQPLVMAKHDGYCSYYDLYRHCPAVVVWSLTAADCAGRLKPTSRRFKTDTKLPTPRVKDSDLKGSGYVRGHLCPAGDRDSNKGLLKETYLTSNMAPQTMVCNSGPWKQLEDTCRVLARAHGKMKIAAGCIFADPQLGTAKIKNIWVPVAFFRIARCSAHPTEIWCWIVQNSWSTSHPVRVGTNELQHVLHGYPETTAAGSTNYGSVVSVLKMENLID